MVLCAGAFGCYAAQGSLPGAQGQGYDLNLSYSRTTLKAVAELGSGYTYLVSRAGVTGAETKAGMPVEGLINTLREFNAPPALLGFGISEPAQVREAIAAGAAGAISGSAVVKIIETHHKNPEHMLTRLKEFVEGMKAATNK